MTDKYLLTPARSNDRLEHALLSAWMDAADVGLCVMDDASRVVMINPAACSLLGVDGLLVLNAPLKKMLEALTFERGADLLQSIGTPGIDGEQHVVRKTPNGLLQLLFKSATVRADRGSLFKTFAITDITTLLAAQQRIDSVHQRRRWEAINAGVVICNAQEPDMPIVYVNSKFEEMSGYHASEVIGRNCRFLQGVSKAQPALESIRSAIKNRTNGYALLRNYRKDGSIFLNELFISPFNNQEGNVTHFIGIQHLQSDGSNTVPK